MEMHKEYVNSLRQCFGLYIVQEAPLSQRERVGRWVGCSKNGNFKSEMHTNICLCQKTLTHSGKRTRANGVGEFRSMENLG